MAFSGSGCHAHTGVGAGWVILDILGFIVPIIIDAATRAWYDLDRNEIHVLLQPVSL